MRMNLGSTGSAVYVQVEISVELNENFQVKIVGMCLSDFYKPVFRMTGVRKYSQPVWHFHTLTDYS